MITYTWSVNSVIVVPEQGSAKNIISFVSYSVVGDENGTTADFSFSQHFSYNEEQFIPFEQLTEDTVTEWAKQVLGKNGVSVIEENIRLQIENKNNPVAVPKNMNLPWKK